MEAEQNGVDRKDLIAKREELEVFISPRTFQKYKSIKRITDGPKLVGSQTSKTNGSTHQNSVEETYVMKVTAEEYDHLKKKYTKNKKFMKRKAEEPKQPRSKSKSPSSLKTEEPPSRSKSKSPSLKHSPRLEETNKREKSTSPRISGAGTKQNGMSSHGKSSEKASKISLKPERKPASRKSYDVAESKPKSVCGSRWSAGMANDGNVFNNKIVDASSLKCNQAAPVWLEKKNHSKSDESSNGDVSDSTQQNKGLQKVSRIPKSPDNLQANDYKKDNAKRDSFEKENRNKTSKFHNSKEHETSRSKNVKTQNTKNHNRINGDEIPINSNSKKLEQDNMVNNSSIPNIKQVDTADFTQKNQHLTIKLHATPQNNIPNTNQEDNLNNLKDKTNKTNNLSKKMEYDKCGNVKLDGLLGAAVCEDKKVFSLNGKISTDNSQNFQDLLEATAAGEVTTLDRVINNPFVTKRTDIGSSPDALQPSVDLDACLQISLQDTSSKCEGSAINKNSNDNNFPSMQYEAVPGTSKTVDTNPDQEIGSPLAFAIKLAKKAPPAARTPIMLKTPKRLKDGEVMSEMLIYKLGSHSTPRKIRKNRNLDSLRKSDWGTPATDRITSAFLKRSISKKIKGKMFVKKSSKGILHPLHTSKLIPKNSPKRENNNKSPNCDTDVETYKVTPVSHLIKKFENLEKKEESTPVQNKVTVTFKKNAIFEKWQNGAKNIQQGLHLLKEVKKKPSVPDATDTKANEISSELTNLKLKSINTSEIVPTSNNNLIHNEDSNSITISKTDSVECMSFVSLKFDEIFSAECADQSGKNSRFSDLFKEINFQLSDSEKNETNEVKYEENLDEVKDSEKHNQESTANSILQNSDHPSAEKTTILANNDHAQEKILAEDKVSKNLKDENSMNSNNSNVRELLGKCEEFSEKSTLNESPQQVENKTTTAHELTESRSHGNISKEQIKDDVCDDVSTADEGVECQEGDDLENSTQEPPGIEANKLSDQPMGGFRGFEEVVIAEGKVDTMGEDRASPAYEAGVDEIKDEDFGEIFREKLLSSSAPDDDDTSISTLLALSQKLSKQPTSYADYRKQFMEVKSRSLPPQHNIKTCHTDSKMSL